MKIFYHNDLDGKCAAAILYNKMGRNLPKENMVSYNYGEFPLDIIMQDENIFIVDLSFSISTEHVLDAILAKTKNVVWIDHHEATFDLLEKRPDFNKIIGIRRNDASGAMLTWEYCYENISAPKAVAHVDDYDRWVYDLKYTAEFKYAIGTEYTVPWADIWQTLLGKGPAATDYLLKLYRAGESILAYLKNDWKSQARNAYESVYKDLDTGKNIRCLVLNGRGNSNLFGDLINDYPFVVLWSYNGEDYVYSFYSNKEDINCNKIANQFGGGGHKGAAGCRSKKLLFPKIK